MQSVVELGHTLGLTTVAERVEDEATWDRLGEMGCDVARGCYLRRPMTAEQPEVWFGTTVAARV